MAAQKELVEGSGGRADGTGKKRQKTRKVAKKTEGTRSHDPALLNFFFTILYGDPRPVLVRHLRWCAPKYSRHGCASEILK